MAKNKFLSAAKDGAFFLSPILRSGPSPTVELTWHPSSCAGFGFCSVVHGWDLHDKPYEPELSVSNLANGYRDLVARVDLETYRRTHTSPSIPLFLCTLLDPETKEGMYADPRAVLQKVVKDLATEGWEAMAGAEVRPPSPPLSLAVFCQPAADSAPRLPAVRVLSVQGDADLAVREGLPQPNAAHQGHARLLGPAPRGQRRLLPRPVRQLRRHGHPDRGSVPSLPLRRALAPQS